jgi:hypothetical protein
MSSRASRENEKLFALAIPHLPELADRAANMNRLRAALEPEGTRAPAEITEFHEKGPWPARTLARWNWFLTQTERLYFLQLEDDVVIPEDGRFWPSVRAMVEAWPNEPLCLAATHSMGPLVAQQGRRSYRTPKMIGWGWLAPRAIVARLFDHARAGGLDAYLKRCETTSAGFGRRVVPVEDGYLAETLVGWGMLPRHPCPTVVDQLFLPSTLSAEGFDEHTHTQATVTWREFSAKDMASPDWWRTPATLLPIEYSERIVGMMGTCGWCGRMAGEFFSRDTCASLCKTCVMRLALKAMGADLPSTPAPAAKKAAQPPAAENGTTPHPATG